MFAAFDQGIINFHKGFQTGPGNYEDPTYLGFKFIFDFDPTHRDPNDKLTHDALFASAEAAKDHGLDSAEAHLKAIGYENKAKMLKAFKENLRYVNTVTPYYFQSIEGVNELWKVEKGENFNNYRGKEKVLTINCLEGIDMRITAMADMYRKATFDYVHMRELLPENLKHFSMIIQIAEMRKFHRIKSALTTTQTAGGSNDGVYQSSVNKEIEFELVDNLISVIQFKLQFCEFDFEDSFPAEELNMNGDMQPAKQKIKIRVGKITEHNYYTQMGDLELKDNVGVIDNSSVTGQGLNGADSAGGNNEFKNSKEFDNAFNQSSRFSPLGSLVAGGLSDLQKKLERAGGDLVSRAVNTVQSKIVGVALGNVYDDLRNQSLGTIVNGFVNKNDQINNSAVGGDVYPNVPEGPKDYPKDLGNIYK